MRITLVDGVRLHGDPGTSTATGDRTTGAPDPAVEIAGRRGRVALAALALAGRSLTAAELADVLWPTGPPTTWQTALRVVVRDLRRTVTAVGAVGPDVVTTTASGYRLAPAVAVDVLLAAADVDRAAGLLEGDPVAALAAVEPWLGVSGDRLLPGEDAEWLAPHRASLDALGVRAAVTGAAAALAAGDPDRALALARRAVADAPLEESAHRALLTVLADRGERAAVVEAYERCRALLADELGIDPSDETVAVYLAALGSAPRPGRAAVPVTGTPLVARDPELAALLDALAPGAVVTLTGPRGIGKSRLAAEAAIRVRGQLAVAWSTLAAVGQDELVAGAVAADLGLSPGAADPTRTVTAQLAADGRTLVVLDGADDALDGAAALAEALRREAPATTVLLTATRPAGVTGEVVVRVGPLGFRADPGAAEPAALQQVPALVLLQQRVGRSGRGLQLDRRTAPALLAVCERTGGVPLAVELAAAQLAVMAPGDLVDQLEQLADLSGPAGPAEQVRTFARQACAQLDEAESAVFRRLGLLGGPVGIPFLRGVLQGSAVPPLRLPRALRELTDRHLATVDPDGPHWTYDMDDDLRSLAEELCDDAERDRTLGAAVAALRALLPDDPAAPPARYAAEVAAVRPTLRSVQARVLRDDVDPALRDAVLDLTFRLHRWYAATDVTEGRYWLRRYLAATTGAAGRTGAAGPTGSAGGTGRAEAAFALGYLSYWAGDLAAATEELGTVVELFAGRSSPYLTRALIYLAGLLDDLDRADEAVATIRQAIDAAADGDLGLRVAAAMGVGSLLAERGDPEAARHADAAVALCRDGTDDQLAVALPTAAMVCWQVGETRSAAAHAERALAMLGTTPRIARLVALTASTGVALARDDDAAARRWSGAADAEGTALGVERELPLARSLRALALLADDPAAAAQAAAGAVRAAAGVGAAASALPLEVAVTVLHASGGADEELLRRALATAAGIRRSGSRPVPPTLRGRLVLELPGGGAVDPQQPSAALPAVREQLLAALTG